MEMGNVSKRQQPDHRADNSRRSPTGLQWLFLMTFGNIMIFYEHFEKKYKHNALLGLVLKYKNMYKNHKCISSWKNLLLNWLIDWLIDWFLLYPLAHFRMFRKVICINVGLWLTLWQRLSLRMESHLLIIKLDLQNK